MALQPECTPRHADSIYGGLATQNFHNLRHVLQIVVYNAGGSGLHIIYNTAQSSLKRAAEMVTGQYLDNTGTLPRLAAKRQYVVDLLDYTVAHLQNL